MLVNVERLYKYYNGVPLLRDVNFTIGDRETVGLIGRNGCGKSTLLNILLGRTEFDKTPEGKGAVSVAGGKIIGYLAQNSGFPSDETIGEEIRKPFAPLLELKREMNELAAAMAEGDEAAHDAYAAKAAFFETREGYLIDVKINTVLNGMGFADTPQERRVSTLSGGEKTRLALAALLLKEPDLLILDEPTNHLDFKTLSWLEDYLRAYKKSVIVVSHDRYFLDKLCTRILEIEGGVLTSYRGNYSAFLKQKKLNSERREKEFAEQKCEIAKLEDFVARNRARASTAKLAQSRQKALDKMERIEQPLNFGSAPVLKLEYDVTPPKEIMTVRDCPITVGGKTLVQSFSLAVRRGDKVALVGSNGIGKTTVLKVLQGLLPHAGGSVFVNDNVRISYFEQENAQLHGTATVLDEVWNRYPRMSEFELRRVLAGALLTGEDVYKPSAVLSGGERAKLSFALMTLRRGNVLLLDEPTNHLDLASKEVLEQALAEFDGTILFVSHDRYLINKIADRVVEITADGVAEFKGAYDDYAREKAEWQAEADRAASLAKEKAASALQTDKKQYRTREMRARDAKRKERIRTLEAEIEQAEETALALEREIAAPEIASDFALLHEKCAQMEALRADIDALLEEWTALGDGEQPD
ncbi:MAG: ABC-F family ATP-binding cassette domain-containing protein [Oscillospiraceae bacterium]